MKIMLNGNITILVGLISVLEMLILCSGVPKTLEFGGVVTKLC